MSDIIYDLTLRHYGMPWWDLVGQALFVGVTCLAANLTVARHQIAEEKKRTATAERLYRYYCATALRHDAGCRCPIEDECPNHGKLEFRARLDPDTQDFVEAAELHRTWEISKKIRLDNEREEFLDREAAKLDRKEAAKAQAAQIAQAREAVEESKRAELQALAELKRRREVEAHTRAEADRNARNDNKQRNWESFASRFLDDDDRRSAPRR